MYEKAIEILNLFTKNGYEAYIIGGFVRDHLLGIRNDDIDIITSAKPEEIKSLFTIPLGLLSFVAFSVAKFWVLSYSLFEITTFRIENNYKGRYPDVSFTNNLKDDLVRRDFTINAICLDKDGRIVDLMNGFNDLNDKLIRCIGNIEIKLKEDPLRILRAIRFAGKLNFEIETNLKSFIKNNGYLLEKLSINKTKQELDKMEKNGLKILEELDLNRYIRR